MDFRKLMMGIPCVLALALTPAAKSADSGGPGKSKPKRNVIVFVADGLRAGSVNAYDTPTLLYLRNHGVFFSDSHSLFPTFTTANASAISTGHQLGDTGDFSNTLYAGFGVFDTGNFGTAIGTQTPFVENNRILADLDDHFSGDYLNEQSIMAAARLNGYNTASVGKVGPIAIQDVTELQPVNKQFPTPNTVFIDDSTGTTGIPLSQTITNALTDMGLATIAPNRTNGCAATDQCSNGLSGTNATPGTLAANVTQQKYFADALTKSILPTFGKTGKPFFVLFWSRDPDGTQHNQGDSLNSLTPGINGPTSRLGINNADNNLRQLFEYIQSHPELKNNTDIVVTADHGFSTISRHDLNADGTRAVDDYASKFIYKDSMGRQEVNTGFLPTGFLAIDIANHLQLPLFDPDVQVTDGTKTTYKPVDPGIGQNTASVAQRPVSGDALIGGTGVVQSKTDAEVVVAANGGSDLIYVTSKKSATVGKIVDFLSKRAYVGGLFVDEAYGEFPGSLPLSKIGLVGSSPLPRPTIVVNFRTFATNPLDKVNSRVELADTGLQQGQGMHGNLSRADTFNNMAAWGPDFKRGYDDKMPVSNADLAPTLAHILGLSKQSNGNLGGRVIEEALSAQSSLQSVNAPVNAAKAKSQKLVSAPNSKGISTVLLYQEMGSEAYYDEACLADYSTAQVRANPCR